MKKIEGTYYCHRGIIITQASVLDILNSKEDDQIKKLIKRINRRNKKDCNVVKVTFSLTKEGE